MAKGKKTGGRKKGTPNKMPGAQQHLRDAWEKCAGPKTAERLIKSAIEKAMGYQVSEKTYEFVGNGEKRKRVLAKEKVWREFHFEPLAALLPYIAKRMPQEHEVKADALPTFFTLATDGGQPDAKAD